MEILTQADMSITDIQPASPTYESCASLAGRGRERTYCGGVATFDCLSRSESLPGMLRRIWVGEYIHEDTAFYCDKDALEGTPRSTFKASFFSDRGPLAGRSH